MSAVSTITRQPTIRMFFADGDAVAKWKNEALIRKEHFPYQWQLSIGLSYSCC
jgi:hypothetical protein